MEVGASVTALQVGDEVYTRLPEASRGKHATNFLSNKMEILNGMTGAWAQYAVCSEEFVAPKPRSLSFEDAASIPLAALTALQALRKYNGSLVGKTVFIPAGCESHSILLPLNAQRLFECSERDRGICVPTRKERLSGRQSHHHGLDD